jgi:hypothetical protein
MSGCFVGFVVDENGDPEWMIPLGARAARTLFGHDKAWESRLNGILPRLGEANIMIAEAYTV